MVVGRALLGILHLGVCALLSVIAATIREGKEHEKRRVGTPDHEHEARLGTARASAASARFEHAGREQRDIRRLCTTMRSWGAPTVRFPCVVPRRLACLPVDRSALEQTERIRSSPIPSTIEPWPANMAGARDHREPSGRRLRPASRPVPEARARRAEGGDVPIGRSAKGARPFRESGALGPARAASQGHARRRRCDAAPSSSARPGGSGRCARMSRFARLPASAPSAPQKTSPRSLPRARAASSGGMKRVLPAALIEPRILAPLSANVRETASGPEICVGGRAREVS